MTEAVSSEYRFGEYRVLLDKAQVFRGDDLVALTPKAVQMLIICIEHRDRVVTKDEIFERVWPDVTVEEGNIAYTASLIRKTLGRNVLTTVSGLGYRFVAPIHGDGSAHRANTNLPAYERDLIGRQTDVSRLLALLTEPGLITVIGLPGVGKTSLARSAGSRALETFPDGVWYLEVSCFQSVDALAGTLGTLVGVRLAKGDDVPADLARAVVGKRMLLVLDGCESARAVLATLLEPLVSSCPHLRVIATSRTLLDIRGERVLRLGPLPTEGTPADIDRAIQIPAVALFVARAQAANAEFGLSDADAPIIADLCKALDGLPLAIEMVAARASAVDFRVLRDRLTAFTLRSESPLRGALDLSWSLLSPTERQVLVALSVCTGSFDFGCAQAVAGVGMDDGDLVECLGKLVDHSLVATEIGRVRRYRLLDTVRAYLMSRLSAAALSEHHRLVAEHYIAKLRQANQDWNRTSIHVWLGHLVDDLDGLRGALNWAFAANGDRALGLALAGAAHRLWSDSNAFVEGRSWLEKAITIMPEEDPESSIAATIWYGYAVLVGTADVDLCGDACVRAARLFKLAGDSASEGVALAAKGMTEAFRGAFANAEKTLRRAARLLARSDRPKNLSACLENLAYVYGATNRMAEAVRALQDAAKASRGTRDIDLKARIELGLAELAFMAGEPEDAAARAEVANGQLRTLGRHPLRALGLVNHARYLEAAGEVVLAREIAGEAMHHVGGRLDANYLGLIDLVALLGVDSAPTLSAGLLGWVEGTALRKAQPRQPSNMPTYERLVAALRRALSPSRLAAALREGESWEFAEALAKAEELLGRLDTLESQRRLPPPLLNA
jgi:predicted ATPase/DNA-binding winged helix-turn-helix (wHTH) protein